MNTEKRFRRQLVVTRKRPPGHLNAVMDQQEGDGSGWAALLLHIDHQAQLARSGSLESKHRS